MGWLRFAASHAKASPQIGNQFMASPSMASPVKESKAQKVERLKRTMNPWDGLAEIRRFAREGFASDRKSIYGQSVDGESSQRKQSAKGGTSEAHDESLGWAG